MDQEGLVQWLAARVRGAALGVVGVSVGGGAILLIALEDDFYIEQIIGMGCGTLLGVVGGGYAVVKITRTLRQHMGTLDDLLEEGQRLLKRLIGQEVIPAADWLGLVSEQYKPGRRSYKLPAGVDENGRIVEYKMEGPESHLLITGTTGTGKSVYVNQLITAAAMSGRYQVVITALSGKDYYTVRDMKNVHLLTAMDRLPKDADADRIMAKFAQDLPNQILSFNREVVRRQRLATAKGQRELIDIRADQRPPAVLFVVEEFLNALEQVKSGFTIQERQDDGSVVPVKYKGSKAKAWVMGQITVALQFGRSSLMHLVLLGQRPTAAIPNGIKKQMILSTFRVSDAQEAAWATAMQKSGAETLRLVDAKKGVPGQIFVKGAFDQHRLTVPLTSDDMLTEAAQMYETIVDHLGEPTWVYGYKDSEKVEAGQGGGENEFRSRTDDSDGAVPAVPTVPTMMITEPDPEVGVGLTTDAGGDTAGDASPGTGVGTPADDRQTIPKMPASLMSVFVGRLLEKNDSFQDRTPAYSDMRTLQLFMYHYENYYRPEHKQVSENEMMEQVFGNRGGRYRPYVQMCGRFSNRLIKHYESRVKAEQTK